ncbi:hypothetical protein O181_023765 [Austropuccinia psidii MF-1]|uniref:Uncharacterized protein n=1 Tax=Austropuccinia psidii MF-1 TaxID=1389203 RepID=A0A9Q3CJQ1_9BASI|nr:hypothetical protein [Austropuccinia psidii MF-1]
MNQDINKSYNERQKIQPQTHGHVFGNALHLKEDIKPGGPMEIKYRSPSQYQDGDNMTYSEKEVLKQLPEATVAPKFSCVGEYDHMRLIDYVDLLFIDVHPH